MSWREFRIFVEHLGLKSALYRSRHPKTWPWGVDTEFLAAILFVLQGANWQRSGGKGEKPKHVKRPKDGPELIDTEVSTDARKKALDDEIARRRARRDRQRSRHKSKLINRLPNQKETG